MKLARLTTMVLAAVIAAVLATHAQSKDPLVGTWTLNAAKSKYTPGPTPKSITSIYEAAGKGYKVTVKNDTGGGTVQYSYTTNLDGTGLEGHRQQSQCGHDRREAHRRPHARDHQQEERQGHHHAAQRRLSRRQDADGHDDRHRCAWAEGEQRRGVREKGHIGQSQRRDAKPQGISFQRDTFVSSRLCVETEPPCQHFLIQINWPV